MVTSAKRKRKRKKKTLAQLLLQTLISRYPIFFWGSLWAIAMMLTVGATVSLLNPAIQPAREPLPLPANLTPEGREDNTPTGNLNERGTEAPERALRPYDPNPPKRSLNPLEILPFWLISLISVGCAASSMIMTLVLRHFCSPRQRLKQLPPARPVYQLPPARYPEVERNFDYPQYTPVSPPREMPRVMATPRASSPPSRNVARPVSHQISSVPQSRNVSRTVEPQITIVPPEMVTPLDYPSHNGESAPLSGNLAEQMDLRRRYTLSSLMDNL
ncbi:hypothetical protein [Spirulina subsalsa]|uniref:hypothetical protein n=1 Tax=Spirulina subsalsa TaxID=54311 RepID=UPI0002E21EF2|nr:hypothetical protein [Spirulina subsalsa]